MPCTRITLTGIRAIVCTSGRRPRCVCGARPVFQCDYPTKRRSGTCDRHLCARCAVVAGQDKHLCPVHAAAPAKLDVEVAAEPKQGELL